MKSGLNKVLACLGICISIIEMKEDIMVSRYVVLTGDLKSSRKLKDRAKVQESLNSSLIKFWGY
ncbi:MAG: hypothetical protein J7J21_03770 [Methanomicrobia archaeon]|nr:hypothetical protein [Methanomicrobia archaeon]